MEQITTKRDRAQIWRMLGWSKGVSSIDTGITSSVMGGRANRNLQRIRIECQSDPQWTRGYRLGQERQSVLALPDRTATEKFASVTRWARGTIGEQTFAPQCTPSEFLALASSLDCQHTRTVLSLSDGRTLVVCYVENVEWDRQGNHYPSKKQIWIEVKLYGTARDIRRAYYLTGKYQPTAIVTDRRGHNVQRAIAELSGLSEATA